jgi:hypothetical protein
MMRNDLACLKSRATPAAVAAWVDLEPRYVKAPIAAAPALTDPGEPQYGPADIAELPWLTRPIRCAALTPLRLHPARQRPQPVGPPAQYTVDRTEHAFIASHGRDGVVQRPADSACSSYPHPIHSIRCAIHLLHSGSLRSGPAKGTEAGDVASMEPLLRACSYDCTSVEHSGLQLLVAHAHVVPQIFGSAASSFGYRS